MSLNNLRPANLEKSNVSTDLDVPGYTHSATEKKVENVESGDEMEYEEEEDEMPGGGKSKLHQINSGYKCFYCNQIFSALYQLSDHQIKECLQYAQRRCEKSKDDEKSESRAAVPAASRNTNIKCSHCHDTFSGLRNLYDHFSRCLPREVKELDLNETNTPQPQRFHNCLICNEAYAEYEDFARHEKSTHHAEQMKAVDMNKTNRRHSRRTERNFHSIELSDGSVEYPCNICGTRFKTYQKVQRHKRRCYDRKFLNKTDIETSEDEDEDKDMDMDKDKDENSIPDWLQSGWYADDARENAEDALELFNKEDGGKMYELVEAGPYSLTMISGGPIYHLNFQGKAKDCPNAQVETFFAQTRKHPSLVLDFCVSLGPSDELPRWKDANNRGCYYCRWSTIHHPAEKHEKLISGCRRPGEGVWLYGA